ncbi:MAG TPA: lysophospholipid acyltransferase family protein [Bdellovibrionota bacterium]|jgi:1-acyl-sn-glycerol-3-phosphate acyltransferase|nr:lysophospholipid acyltransferase family protein [Bdellovibrionota bacterium]
MALHPVQNVAVTRPSSLAADGVAFVRTCAVWTFSITFWTLYLTVEVLTLRQLPDRWFVGCVRWWAARALWLVGARLDFPLEDPMVEPEARVLICNHQSGLDLLWGGLICPARPLAIGKKELIWIPLVNVLWWALRFIRIDRSNTAKALEALEGVAEEVRTNRRTLILAPEGTRTRDGRIGPFKKGAFQIARKAGVKIHPVVVHGPFACMPRGSFLMRGGSMRLRYLEPVDVSGWKDEDLEAQIEKVRLRMIEVLVALGGRP